MIEKFYREINKSDYFYAVKINNENLLILTSIDVNEHKEILGNVFQPYSCVSLKKIPTFFLLTNEENSPLITDFAKRKFPILNLKKKLVKPLVSKKEILRIVNEFILGLKGN